MVDTSSSPNTTIDAGSVLPEENLKSIEVCAMRFCYLLSFLCFRLAAESIVEPVLVLPNLATRTRTRVCILVESTGGQFVTPADLMRG